jgi:hypothetical protein
MLEALIIQGETDPGQIAHLAKGSLKKKEAQIARALEGFYFAANARFLNLIRQALEHLADIQVQIDELEADRKNDTGPARVCRSRRTHTQHSWHGTG